MFLRELVTELHNRWYKAPSSVSSLPHPLATRATTTMVTITDPICNGLPVGWESIYMWGTYFFVGILISISWFSNRIVRSLRISITINKNEECSLIPLMSTLLVASTPVVGSVYQRTMWRCGGTWTIDSRVLVFKKHEYSLCPWRLNGDNFDSTCPFEIQITTLQPFAPKEPLPRHQPWIPLVLCVRICSHFQCQLPLPIPSLQVHQPCTSQHHPSMA